MSYEEQIMSFATEIESDFKIQIYVADVES